MKYGYVKIVAASPDIRVADLKYNAEKIVDIVRGADSGVSLIAMPELGLCGSTCGDLFFQDTLVKGCESAVEKILAKTKDADTVFTIGAPVRLNNAVFNCIIVVHTGEILGIVPKEYPCCGAANGDARYFAPAPDDNMLCSYTGREVPFGPRLIFSMNDMPDFTFGIVVGEDAFMPQPLSASLALEGASVIVNCSASAETAGKEERRRFVISAQSARLSCGYVYANAGSGESTTDKVFSAQNIIAENGKVLDECVPFSRAYAESEIDVSAILSERAKRDDFSAMPQGCEVIGFDMQKRNSSLSRTYSRYPFIPEKESELKKRCGTILAVQSHGLAKRIEHSRAKKAVVGISGGLDSCLALLVAVRAFDILSRPASDILAVTMPCFGTTVRTRNNAEILVSRLGASFECVDITRSVTSHFDDIGHDIRNKNVVFENAQARARTYVLMDIANRENGIVVGTGDLSELALGWATYNGDHMSMYGVNAGVPKTLIRHMVAYAAETADDTELACVLRDILETPVSPELLPAENGEIAQKTEDIVGPYELHDFILYHVVRHGFSPAKIMFLLKYAFSDKYDAGVLKKWLVNFYRRFFSQQFKRSCLPDGPKIGTVSLSPRGDFFMPSDASVSLWLKEAEAL